MSNLFGRTTIKTKFPMFSASFSHSRVDMPLVLAAALTGGVVLAARDWWSALTPEERKNLWSNLAAAVSRVLESNKPLEALDS